jgi:hypothetical protein
MDYVMVPVPEELVAQVELFMFQLRGRGKVAQWDDGAMGRHLLALADEPRAVLSAVAAGVVADNPVDSAQLAEEMQVSVRELFGLVMEANDVTVAPYAGALIFARRIQVDDGAGGTRGVRALHMLSGQAHAVRAQESILGLRRTPRPS